MGYPWAFPRPPGASRRPPVPETNQSKKLRNLKELTEQWSLGGGSPQRRRRLEYPAPDGDPEILVSPGIDSDRSGKVYWLFTGGI